MVAVTDTEQVALPPLPLEGGCCCGAVRYRLAGAPLTFYLCHCTECQRHTSSAFGESLRVHASHFAATGTVRVIERVSDSGSRRQGWFCPECGVRLWHSTIGSAEINIKAGTLDDTGWLKPAGHIWVRSAQPFVRFEPNALIYETQPEPGYLQLKSRWQEMTLNA